MWTPGLELLKPGSGSTKDDCELTSLPVTNFRCMDTEQARRLVRAGEGELVEGVEEEQYWAKIKKDREEKRSGKVVVPKVKNKKKLMQRIETMKSAHVYFD